MECCIGYLTVPFFRKSYRRTGKYREEWTLMYDLLRALSYRLDRHQYDVSGVQILKSLKAPVASILASALATTLSRSILYI